MSKSPIKTLSKKQVYTNPWLTLEEHTVIHQNGKKGIYGVLDYGDGVSILIQNKEAKFLLIKEYKYGISAYTYQLPSGGVDDDEDALKAAKRELLEEAGFVADDWTLIGVTHPFPTNITTKVNLYLATGLRKEGEPEPGIELRWVDENELLNLLNHGEISHSGSMVCILSYLHQKAVERSE